LCSQFLFRYSKEEDLEPGGKKMMSFTHLLIGNQTVLQKYQNTHKTFSIVKAFQNIKVNFKSLPPLQINLQPYIWTLEKLKK
jgi:hypothetical protein